MKYKNVTKGNLRFRAADSKGVKRVFDLKPGEEMESDREVRLGGLEKVSNIKQKKPITGGGKN